MRCAAFLGHFLVLVQHCVGDGVVRVKQVRQHSPDFIDHRPECAVGDHEKDLLALQHIFRKLTRLRLIVVNS